MKNYLVTGCAGFIASHVCLELLNQGHTVVGVDNLNPYYDVKLKEWRLENLKLNDKFMFFPIDVENKKDLDELLTGKSWDGIIHLAARAGVRASMENPFVYLSTNTLGTLNLLECMRETGIKNLVMASTSSIYANEQMPFDENKAVNYPISPYAASKKAAELMAHSYHYLYDLNLTMVRYFTVYGPFGRPDMCIYRFIYWIDNNIPITLFGDGKQSRDFTFVEDIAKGTILASEVPGYNIINLGGGKTPVSLLEVISILEELLGKKAQVVHKEFHQADLKSTRANIEKAKKLLNWEPSTDLNIGIEKTVKWYTDNREKVNKIKLPCN